MHGSTSRVARCAWVVYGLGVRRCGPLGDLGLLGRQVVRLGSFGPGLMKLGPRGKRTLPLCGVLLTGYVRLSATCLGLFKALHPGDWVLAIEQAHDRHQFNFLIEALLRIEGCEKSCGLFNCWVMTENTVCGLKV